MYSILELERKVVDAGICTNCGACQGMCPYWKSFEGRTFVDYDCDRKEGRCKYFCPRMPADLDALRQTLFGGDGCEIIPELGPFRALYLTRAADPEIRARAQHGGTMTALVEFALAEGFIDAAVLSKAGQAGGNAANGGGVGAGVDAAGGGVGGGGVAAGCQTNDGLAGGQTAGDGTGGGAAAAGGTNAGAGTLDPAGCLVTSPAEVRECSGSSFQIPPTLAVLNEALAADEYKKIGVVGTPCKTLAVAKMKAKPYADNDNHADNIGMVFGLFCGWGLDWKGLAALGDAGHVDILPSKFHRMDMDDRQVDLDEVLPLVRNACKYCDDMTAEFADLSVGGARSAEGWDVDKGWNQLIVRTAKGAALVDAAREKGILEFRSFGDEDAETAALDKLIRASASKRAKALKL